MLDEIRKNIKIPKIIISKRKEAQELLNDVMDKLDPSGTNKEKYIKEFEKMSDKEYAKFMEDMFRDDNMDYILDIIDGEREVDLEKAKEAAKILDLPLEEFVAYPFLNHDVNNPILSKVKLIYGFLIYKRMQQTAQKKNSTSIDISKRSPLTNQVIGDDKNGKSTDLENMSLALMGANYMLKETLGPKSDGLDRKNQFYRQIAENGYCSLEELDAGIDDRITLNTVNIFLLCMGIKTDLISDDYLLPYTAENIKKRDLKQ